MSKKKTISFYLTFIIITIIVFLLYCIFTYKLTFNKFKNSFNNDNYLQAYSIINKKSFNPVTLIKKNIDLKAFLTTELEKLNNEFLSGKLTQEEILLKVNKIETFNVLETELLSFKNSLPIVSISKENFDKSIEFFNDNNYEKALEYFNKISPLDSNYKESLKYKNECISLLKDDLLVKVDKHTNNNEYSKGILLLEENLEKFNHDIDIINKLDELEILRMDYLNEYSKDNVNKGTSRTKPVMAYYNKLNASTINEFGINSSTNHLVFVNIGEQKTYVFNGSKDNWSLEKEFLCSTGIEGKETPIGEFKVETRAPWFFSEQYGQGGKYYVQFMGNYLFHSIPFDRDKETILDYTLGEPASHGCIRLAVNDAKWLYDNVKDSSKVIIY